VIRLALRVRRADAEIVLAELLELAPAGVEERDVSSDVVEYAVYGAPGELPAMPDLRAAAGGALVDVATTEVADDWSERWRAFHEPVTVGGRVHVRAPWHPAPAGALEDVVIDPGQAFGTGAHPTTRMCLELLLELEPDGAVLDLGCGSGVLSIAAAKLGYQPVTALDLDDAAVAATRTNAEANRVELTVARRDVLSDPLPLAHLALANIASEPLGEVAGRIEAAELVASGYLVSEEPELGGWKLEERKELHGWAADRFSRA
jgi:ribosomal protein L11 methyltransferase